MECQDRKLKPEFEKKIFQIFSDFMTRVAKFEELVSSGSKSLAGFQQGLEFLRRPPINKTSELIERIFTANETRRVAVYVEAGCVSVHDRIQNISKLHTCQLGLLDHLTKAKSTVNELEGLVKEMTGVMQTTNDSKAHFLQEAAIKNEFDLEPVNSYKDEATSSCEPQKPEVIDYATTMGVIYSMVKQDFNMQEKIISSLNLKSSSGELESYNLMWSLRPFVNDEIMHQAWRFIP
ncbi:uncharacterized protein LOC127809929 [Diospyros lotus]|uniref:uncharacterized protein LOC127809929 n=1 Tax=Diospyros lotus TaxID=55363 RepID=UPI0022572EEE|nr:uncharacterized protein LOC127809929 [Diospyros lotus]